MFLQWEGIPAVQCRAGMCKTLFKTCFVCSIVGAPRKAPPQLPNPRAGETSAVELPSMSALVAAEATCVLALFLEPFVQGASVVSEGTLAGVFWVLRTARGAESRVQKFSSREVSFPVPDAVSETALHARALSTTHCGFSLSLSPF